MLTVSVSDSGIHFTRIAYKRMWLAEHEARGRTQPAILCAQSCAPDERVVPPDNATWSENMRFQIHECRVYVWTSKHLTPEICDSVTECALVGGIADIATRAMETGTHDDSWENFQNKLVLVSRDRNCVKQKGLGWTSGECVLIMAKWGGHNLRRCYNHVKARQANQMLQKDYTTCQQFAFSPWTCLRVNDAFLRAFVAPRTAAWQPKTPFDLPLRVESPHSASSIPKGLRRLPGIGARGADTWSFRVLVGLLCSYGKHLRMLIERTDKGWTLCTFNLSFANPPAGESVLRPILRPVHVWDGRAWQTHRPGLCGGPGPTRGPIFLGCSPAAKSDSKKITKCLKDTGSVDLSLFSRRVSVSSATGQFSAVFFSMVCFSPAPAPIYCEAAERPTCTWMVLRGFENQFSASSRSTVCQKPWRFATTSSCPNLPLRWHPSWKARRPPAATSMTIKMPSARRWRWRWRSSSRDHLADEAYRRQWSWWSDRGGRQTEWRGQMSAEDVRSKPAGAERICRRTCHQTGVEWLIGVASQRRNRFQKIVEATIQKWEWPPSLWHPAAKERNFAGRRICTLEVVLALFACVHTCWKYRTFIGKKFASLQE